MVHHQVGQEGSAMHPRIQQHPGDGFVLSDQIKIYAKMWKFHRIGACFHRYVGISNGPTHHFIPISHPELEGHLWTNS